MTPEFNVRYFLEHKVLPVAFYGDGEYLKKTLLHDPKNVMLQFYEHAEDISNDYICPYGAEDFDLSLRTYIRNDQFCIGQVPMECICIQIPLPGIVPGHILGLTDLGKNLFCDFTGFHQLIQRL